MRASASIPCALANLRSELPGTNRSERNFMSLSAVRGPDVRRTLPRPSGANVRSALSRAFLPPGVVRSIAPADLLALVAEKAPMRAAAIRSQGFE